MKYGRDVRGKTTHTIGIKELKRIESAWMHAFACLSGETLCPEAANAGVGAYLGYDVLVVLEWEIPALPEPLSDLLTDLVTVATLQLARGERSVDAIRRHVAEASDRLVDWSTANEDDQCAHMHWKDLTGLRILASLLHRNLKLEGTAVIP